MAKKKSDKNININIGGDAKGTTIIVGDSNVVGQGIQKSANLKSVGALWNMPYRRNQFFCGREDILNKLRKGFAADENTALTPLQILSGLGGIGKTQTAVKYIYKYRKEYKDILWSKADSPEALISSFFEIALQMGFTQSDAKVQDGIDALKRWLARKSNWLLILDNVENPPTIEDLIPINPNGNVLITSRLEDFSNLDIAEIIRMDVMNPEEAKSFFLRRTDRSQLEADELEAVQQLAQELGFLPLALEQAGAYIYEKKCDFGEYLATYRMSGLKLLDKAGAKTGKYLEIVTNTWSLNIEQVKETSIASAELLYASAFLDPDLIPLEIITKGASELGPILQEALGNVDTDHLVLNDIVEPLWRYSLIRYDDRSKTYNIHRLVQAVLIKGLVDETLQNQWVERVLKAVNLAAPEDSDLFWGDWERLLPHIRACLQQVEHRNMNLQEAGSLADRVGFYLRNRAQYNDAERFLRQAYTIQEKILGLDHPDIARTLTILAIVFRDRHQYIESDQYFVRARAIYDKNLMRDHRDVAECFDHNGTLYRIKERFAEAKTLFEEALRIRKKIFGPEHRLVAYVLNDLGQLYQAQGFYKDAERFYLDALELRIKLLGTENRETAISFSTLAELYLVLDRLSEAESLCKRAVQAREKTLGPEHPYTVRSLKTLAKIYTAQDRDEEVDLIYQNVLDIQESKLGPEHPDLADTYNSYIIFLQKTNQIDKAKQFKARVNSIQSKDTKKNS